MKISLVCGLLILSATAHASILLDTGPGTYFTYRPQSGINQGIGQPVTVSVATSLTNMAFDLNLANGGAIKYMIWDGTDTTLLFSITENLAASTSPSFVVSPSFSFDLIAGNTYFFGVISDATVDLTLAVGTFNNSTSTFSQNGLTTICCNSNYNNFTTPTPTPTAGATLALQLFGTQAPEPTTFGMIFVAVSVLLWQVRGRVRACKG